MRLPLWLFNGRGGYSMGLILGARGFFVVNSVGCGLFSLTVNVVCLCQIVRTDVVGRLIHLLLFQTLGFVGNLFSSRPLTLPVMSHDDATTATTANDDDGLRGFIMWVPGVMKRSVTFR